MNSETTKLRDYSSLFSRKHGVSWLDSNFNSIRLRIEMYDKAIFNKKNFTYLNYLKKVYREIEVKYPNEYVIKNSFINHWLLDELSEMDSFVCNEFRVGRSVVDLAMFNGRSKAFEIKSEFDTPNRLANQLNDYKKIFNQVYLIIPKSKLELYINFDKDTGIITFQADSSEKFNLIRKPTNINSLDSNELINVLRTNEYKRIVKLYFGTLPEMTSFNQFSICKKLISEIPKEELNQIFLTLIKQRKEKVFLSKNHNKEFNQLSLAMKFSKADHKRIVNNLKELIKF